jgi:hypothetical protein
MSTADDRFSIIRALDHYAECLDQRSWSGLDAVFTADVRADYRAWKTNGLDELRERIRSMLGGCGPSQHLLGNYRIDLDGDRATSRCYAHVMHFGRGEPPGRHYEVWMEYADEWTRTSEGWRSHARSAKATMDRGDRSVLGPG